MSKVACDACQKPAGRGKRIGTACECGGTYTLTGETPKEEQPVRSSDAMLSGQTGMFVPRTQGITVGAQKPLEEKTEKESAKAPSCEQEESISAPIMETRVDLSLEGKLQQELDQVKKAHKQACVENDRLVEALKTANDKNTELLAEIEKLKNFVVVAEEPTVSTPSRRSRGRTATAPTEHTQSNKCAPFCAILHQHIR